MSKVSLYLIQLTNGTLVSDHYGNAILFEIDDAITLLHRDYPEAEAIKVVKRDRRSKL